jgi:hypothetical protein
MDTSDTLSASGNEDDVIFTQILMHPEVEFAQVLTDEVHSPCVSDTPFADNSPIDKALGA